MTLVVVVAALLFWYACGIWGYVFWWTHEHDLKTDDAVAGLVIGLLGPLAWIIGAGIHGTPRKHRVLMRRRQ